jgi:hypothetical protein
VSDFPNQSRGDGRGEKQTADEAKRELLEWSIRADEELHAQVTASLVAMKQSATRALPWAAAGAAGIGLLVRLIGGGGKPREKRSSATGTLVRLAIDLWPVWSSLFKRRDRPE